MIRSIMEMVTESYVRNCDSSITAYYRRIEPSMMKKAPITASVKMLEIIYAVLKRGTL